jgi:hypothetical protein
VRTQNLKISVIVSDRALQWKYSYIPRSSNHYVYIASSYMPTFSLVEGSNADETSRMSAAPPPPCRSRIACAQVANISNYLS